VNVGQPLCAVPRNDLRRQALQPTVQMAEWAADQAVKGTQTVHRPANYLATGEPAYTPQVMFPAVALHGGGQIPAQVLLGIMAQESNFWEATWHARPGDTGNSLVADYYGNQNSNLNVIDYAAADCGYGIAQVTDGMHTGDTQYSSAQQVAIATDYAANIAAAQQILATKWNQLHDANLLVNDGNPAYIENWYFALWAYNSGFHPPGSGNWGVGWLNNPANPRYLADRQPFLRTSPSDANHPADWPYQEKVLGWIETPQDTSPPNVQYAPPVFGAQSGGQLTLPPNYSVFCSPVINNCDPSKISSTPSPSTTCSPGDASCDPCSAEDSTCWWNAQVSWIPSCVTSCATENLSYAAGTPEPAMTPQYPPDCNTNTAPKGGVIVDDMADSSLNALGCPAEPRGGKFTIRLGNNSDDSAVFAPIDLHQLGAGYWGHMWFTHAYDPSQIQRQVTGMWEPSLPGPGYYLVWVHLPDHGGALASAHYVIDPGPLNGVPQNQPTCTISQDTNGVNVWVDLGTYQLRPGARLLLNNMVRGADGTVDVAYDAAAFTPSTAGSPGCPNGS
jgi:hypothetical protein